MLRKLNRKFATNAYEVLNLPINASLLQIENAVAAELKKINFTFRSENQTPEQKAKARAIFDAYAKLTAEPTRVSEATFVPQDPSDGHFLSLENAPKELSQSYVNDLKLSMQRYNFNFLGRYKGGVPNKYSKFRGTALGEPGQFHSFMEQNKLEEADLSPDFHVNRSDVVHFYRYKWDDEENFKMRQTYFRAKVIPLDFTTFKYFGWIILFMFSLWTIGSLYRKSFTLVDLSQYRTDENGVVYNEPISTHKKHD